MDKLQRDILAQADRLARETQHLELQVECIADAVKPDPSVVALATSQAKRVRRESNLLVRLLAILRDNLQPNGGTR